MSTPIQYTYNQCPHALTSPTLLIPMFLLEYSKISQLLLFGSILYFGQRFVLFFFLLGPSTLLNIFSHRPHAVSLRLVIERWVFFTVYDYSLSHLIVPLWLPCDNIAPGVYTYRLLVGQCLEVSNV